MRRALVAIGLVWLGLAAGCGDDDDAVDAAVTADAPANTHTFSGIIQDSETALPVAGMEVCILEYPAVPCDTSSATGRHDVRGVPNGVKYHAVLRKSDYYPKMFLVAPRTTDVFGNPVMQKNEVVASWFAALGISNDSAKAIVTMQVPPGAMFVGSTFSLSPMSGTGPRYGRPDFSFDGTLTATTSSGVGGFVNVTAGTYDAVVAPPSGSTCSTTVAGTLPMSGEVLARAGFITHLNFTCAAP